MVKSAHAETGHVAEQQRQSEVAVEEKCLAAMPSEKVDREQEGECDSGRGHPVVFDVDADSECEDRDWDYYPMLIDSPDQEPEPAAALACPEMATAEPCGRREALAVAGDQLERTEDAETSGQTLTACAFGSQKESTCPPFPCRAYRG